MLIIATNEYCCHIWDNSSCVSLLQAVHRKSVRHVNFPALISDLASLRKVTSVIYGHCSQELDYCVPPSVTWPYNTQRAVEVHKYYVSVFSPRTECCVVLFHFRSCLWIELSYVFLVSSPPQKLILFPNILLTPCSFLFFVYLLH